MQTASHVHRIRECCPDLHIQSVRPVEEGKVNDVLVINEALVFRFPKSDDGVRQLLTELAVLQALRGHVTLPIPDPIYTSAGAPTGGEAFAGYSLIHGEPLRDHVERLKAAEDSRRLAIAVQLAGFMRELHSVPVAGSGLPAHDAGRRESLPTFLEQVRQQLFPHVDTNTQRLVLDEFESYLSDEQNFTYQRVLRHGDLGPGNVLLDPQTQAVSGIIDFGSAGLDDPAADLGFVALWGGHLFGPSFVEHLLRRYPVSESEALRRRIRFFRLVIALHVALGGLQNQSREDLEFGLSQIH
jgi:aminoglycoside 2''-phosphotransferase